MDYLLEDLKTGIKIIISSEQKELLDMLADIDYSATDVKIYIINKNKYYVTTSRNR